MSFGPFEQYYPSSTQRDLDDRFSMSPMMKRVLILVGLLLVLLLVLSIVAALWVNWAWFGSMGYRDSLRTRYQAAIMYFVIGGVISGVFFAVNLALALRRTRTPGPPGKIGQFVGSALFAVLVAGTLAISLLFGFAASSNWETWQLARYSSDYGLSDPVFNKDVSFYLLRLPAYQDLLGFAMWLTIIVGVATAIVYAVRLSVRFADLGSAPAQMKIHLFALAGLLVLLFAVRYLLANYGLVYSERGAVFGASYTDVNVQRWANYALIVISVAIGLLLLFNRFIRRSRWVIYLILAWGFVSVVVGILLPQVVQQLVVEPSELSREKAYIDNNIRMSRAAFDLESVTERELSGQEPLRGEHLEAYPQTLQNIRLWDYRIINTTYQQLQSFVPYYVFLDVDIERYEIDGQIQQVLLSAREFDPDGLPTNSQTWTNKHLVYTHGYGVVSSPVSQVSAQGLPVFVVERIPPVGEPPFEITRPEIYFGENDANWVAVNSDQPEFSGVIGTEPGAGTGYEYEGEARGSVKASGIARRLILSAYLRDRNVFFTDAINDESRILLKRSITERVSEIAPFLRLDPDPYMVISDGKLYWIIDAYTSSDRFPHATRIGGVNYMRPSVKVVVDPYNGNVDLYRTPVLDPVADAFNRAYGDIFKPVEEIPPGLADQFRYPELLFEVQTEAYSAYHVTDPTAFYNGEDLWTVPLEQLTTTTASRRMVPYYVTLTLPGETEPTFALIRPFIPGGQSNRQNMTSWMAGTADQMGTNTLVAYRFPRQETVFGPTQIAARIDQEPEISAQISLWNQSGSEVVRGNLLVIPVGNSLLYVQPLYLQAIGTAGSLPEMQRVIAASSERVVMRETLEEALVALTAGGPPAEPVDEAPDAEDDGDQLSIEALAAEAVAAFERGQEALTQGDWAAYGQAQTDLESALEQMSQSQTDDPAAEATPVAEE